jgi:hypothetical protein
LLYHFSGRPALIPRRANSLKTISFIRSA